LFKINANFENVSSAMLCTKIENKSGVSVSTVEHLMAALYICGIDNLIINLDGPEVPIMDGSAKEFVETINNDEEILLPDNWGGFRVVPVRFEFWVHDDYRFHHRIEYRTTSQGWRTQTLQP